MWDRADGTYWSNTKALEEKGWHEIRIRTPFPKICKIVPAKFSEMLYSVKLVSR